MGEENNNPQNDGKESIDTQEKGFDFNKFLSTDEGRKTFEQYAEKTVAAQLKLKNDELLSEKQAAQKRAEELQAQIDKMSGTGENKNRDRYSKEELQEILGSKQKEWDGQLSSYKMDLEKKDRLISKMTIDNQIIKLLTEAGVKAESLDLLATHIRAPYANGQEKYRIEVDGDGAKVVILDESGRPKLGGRDGFMRLGDLVGEVREKYKDLFSVPLNGGTGAAGSTIKGQPHSISRKITLAEYSALSREERLKIKPGDIIMK